MATDPRPTLQYYDWQVPPAALSDSHKIGWINESTEEGQAWYKSQRGATDDVRRALDVISGRESSRRAEVEARSKIAPNRLKRNMREVVGTLSKLRPMWG